MKKIEKVAFWKNHNQDYESSQLTIVAYCKKAGLNEHTFEYYRDKFRKEKRNRDASRSLPAVASRFVRIEPTLKGKVGMPNLSVNPNLENIGHL